MIQTEQSVTLCGMGGKSRSGVVTLQTWTQPERLKRASKVFGMLMGFALVTVLIPLAHFFLVPAFLIAAPIVALKIYRSESVIVGGKGICPYCEKPFEIAQSKVQWPFRDLCTACQSEVVIKISD